MTGINGGARRQADQALAVPVEPVARLDPTGFDPSRIADPVKRAEAWQLHLYRMLDTERERSRHLHEQLDEMRAIGIMAEVQMKRLTDAAKALVWQHFHPHDPLPGEPRTIGGAIRKIAEILDGLFAIAMEARQGGDGENSAPSEGRARVRRTSPMTRVETNNMVERLREEADLCRNDGADDIAALLEEAASENQSLSDRINLQNTSNRP